MFDVYTKEAFIDLYQKVDGTTNVGEPDLTDIRAQHDALNEIIEEVST